MRKGGINLWDSTLCIDIYVTNRFITICSLKVYVETYVIFALISVFIFAITSVWTKFLLPIVGGPVIMIAIQQLILSIFLGFFILFEISSGYDFLSLFNMKVAFYLIIASFFGFMGFITMIIGFSKGSASVGGVLLSSRVFASIPLAYFIIGEKYTPIIYVMIFFAFIGSVLNSYEDGMDIHGLITLKAKGIRWFIATALFWALANFFIRSLNGVFQAMHFIAFRQLIMLPMAWIAYFITTRRFNWARITNIRQSVKLLCLYNIILLVAQFFFISALNHSLTLVEGLGVMEGSFTFLIGISVAKFYNNDVLQEAIDRKSLFTKFTGTILALTGSISVILRL